MTDSAELAVIVERLDRHVHDHAGHIQELSVGQAVHREILARQAEELSRLRTENGVQYDRMNQALISFQQSVNNLTTTLNQREGESRAKAKWLPLLLGMIGTIIAAVSLAVGLAIDGVL